jgi:hypothetical protein
MYMCMAATSIVRCTYAHAYAGAHSTGSYAAPNGTYTRMRIQACMRPRAAHLYKHAHAYATCACAVYMRSPHAQSTRAVHTRCPHALSTFAFRMNIATIPIHAHNVRAEPLHQMCIQVPRT